MYVCICHCLLCFQVIRSDSAEVNKCDVQISESLLLDVYAEKYVENFKFSVFVNFIKVLHRTRKSQ